MHQLAHDLHQAFIAHKKTLALAESCTGGAVSASLTAIPGASQFFLGSIVAYCEAWKESFLGVPRDVLQGSGSVSEETARLMVEGLFSKTSADFAAAVTGMLGPTGGAVYIAIGRRGETIDVGHISVPHNRKEAIDFLVQTILQALIQRLLHGRRIEWKK